MKMNSTLNQSVFCVGSVNPGGGENFMNRIHRHQAVLLAVSTLSLLLVSCRETPVSNVDRERLFTLSYGRYEDEIDLFQLASSSTGADTQLFMKDGMFYIANSGSQKVLQFTSFGDLLSVYYNAETNPQPSFGAISQQEQGASTRRAVAHPLNHPVYLAVDNLKRLYVSDRLPVERYEFDSENQLVLREVVLRFGTDGQYLDYIGQEGPGGTPFPPIDGVFVTSRNELAVITKSQSGLQVFWFSPDGSLLYRIPFQYRSLPDPYGGEKKAYASLEKIIPDSDTRRLYVKIDYYTEDIDEATRANAGISFDRSCLYPFSIENAAYDERIDLPVFEGVDKDRLGTFSFKKPYELLGITSTGWIFLSTPSESGYTLEILDSRSRRIQRRYLSIAPDELVYNALHVSSGGILSALLASDYDARIVWWRTDMIIGEALR